MATIVFVHAHPDDEASQTAGTMALAAGEGHRVVCIYATSGELGTTPEDVNGGSLRAHRRSEAEESARVLGTARLVWLGYHDSGVTGWQADRAAEGFIDADVDEAARRVAEVLDEENADFLVGYDWHGNYGHPDHVQVHRVTKRAVDLAARRPAYLEATLNRDRMRQLFAMAREAGMVDAEGEEMNVDAPQLDGNPIGTPEAELHWAVDISSVIAQKRAALASHASQPDAASFLEIPEEMFARVMQFEYFIDPGRPDGMVVGWPFGQERVSVTSSP